MSVLDKGRRMGFSISWIGFKGLAKPDIPNRIGLRDTDVYDEANESPFSLAELPTGFTILFSNDRDYGSAEHLISLSAGAALIACQVEEHQMWSAAYGFEAGDKLGAFGISPIVAATISRSAVRRLLNFRLFDAV
jgi:hypothetical protein